MDVILDSNQILSDPRMQGRKFQILFRYLRRTESSLVIPKIVRDEVLARYPERIRRQQERLVAALAALRGLCFCAQLPNIPDLDVQKEMTFFQEQLLRPTLAQVSEIFEGGLSPRISRCLTSVSTGDYSTISAEELARRAINRVKPASEGGEQFRDVILWLMALAYAKQKGHEVGIVSADAHFIDTKGQLYPELQDELKREGVKIHAFKSIEEFFKAVSPSESIGDWIEKYLTSEETKEEIEGLFQQAVADYLDSGWRSRSEITPLGETVVKFMKKGTLYTLAPDLRYAELEFQGSGVFAIGPYVYTKAPPFNPKDYQLNDVQVRADFVISGWIGADRLTNLDVGNIEVHSVTEIGPHKARTQ